MPLSDFIQRLQDITGEGTRETDFRLMQNQRSKNYKQALDQIRQQAARNVQFNAYAIPGQSNQLPAGIMDRDSSTGRLSIYPLRGDLRVTSPYGVNRKGHKQAHSGIDWGAKSGTPIYAPAGGTIRSALFNKVYGNQTILDLGGGRSMMFGHQSGFNVKPGQRVNAGQLIGYVGSTGWSTGPHLHFETWINNKPVNPLSWFM